MTTLNQNFVPPKYVENSQTDQYTVSDSEATSVRVVIDKMTVTNVGVVAAEFSCNLVQVGDLPVDSNLILSAHRIEPGETYGCPELVGHVIEDGGAISTLGSVSNTLVLSVSGRKITT